MSFSPFFPSSSSSTPDLLQQNLHRSPTKTIFKNKSRSRAQKIRFNPKIKMKSPVIFTIDDSKICTINGENHKIEELGKGKHHITYAFSENVSLNINDKIIQLSTAVLKVQTPGRNPRQQHITEQETITAYDYLNSQNIPQAEVFVRPDTFIDTINPEKSGGFWIVDKMDTEASITNPVVKEFVKKWLTKTAQAGKEIIGDFRPDNVMLKNNRCYVIDPTSPQKCKGGRFATELSLTVKRWVGDNNELFKDITEDFPKEIIDEMKTAKLRLNLTSSDMLNIMPIIVPANIL